MIITRRWLNKYIDFTDISNADIAAALNSLGFEVERTHNFDCNSNIVCGRIQVVNEIPDTHLKFCLVDTGQELVDPIVCGASNPAENGYVVVARPGAVLANGTKIAKREIKEYASEGMMCSLSELGIGEKYLTAAEQDEIILTFNEKEVSYDMIGAEDILTKIGLTDYLFEIDLTLNRSDCLSAYELARELARYFKRELFPLELESTENLKEYQNPLKVVIATSAVESAISVNVVKLTPEKSPLKLSDRIWLKINEYQSNIADPFGDLAIKATLETGQPLLLYDFNKIKNPLKITDDYENKTFNIKKGDLVVVEGNEFVELIGIRVNPVYAISATTTEITVLALHLNHIVMRQQQRKVGISNINLHRYIKPLSYATVRLGLSRYLYLLKINGFLAELSVLNFIKEYKKTVEPISITLLEINQFIGHSFTLLEIKALLEPLAFQFKEEGEQLFVTPPVTRTDIFQKVDLIEEIVRLFGYNNIIAKPPVLPNLVKAKRPAEKTIKNFETFFLNNGFYQAKTYALVKQEEITNFNFFNYQKPYQLLSPLSEEHVVMRLSLTNSLLNSVGYNNARNQKNVKLFTVEKIYANEKSYYHGAFVSQVEIVQNKITGDNLSNSYYYIKSLLEAYVQSEQIDINELSYQQAPKNKVYHPYQTSYVFLGKQLLAIIGLIHPAYQKEVNLKSATYFGEINFEVIFNYPQKKQTFFTPLSKFSASNRDISIWVPATVTYEQIKKKILTGVKNVVAIEVIDQYFDHKEMPNYVALTISFTFNDMTKQLTEADINQQFEQIKMNLKKLQLQIR
ncbi:phenylalanine--tRNA ligase subunit beta [Spiroplasma sp. ChiS]|uniref:phenylalanine--tRNA ligase subunit beta n=1 Tax=Spiroplasma sp. ChiS TaxID=2099885 RepID=UPI000CFA4399|nr:phenylalanine--tRNA ligase subunit beta [Spiroplasma sp. ChiS]PQP78097.1 phenylalanine--tRNA ligase subunit beta [Spiroplasma sp. ChiS]